MMPSTTCRWSRNGRPRCPSEDGSNGSIRSHWESLNNAVRDTRPPSPTTERPIGRHALAATLAEFGLADLVGQSRFDVLDALVTRCVGDGSDIEAQAARDAYCEALDALFVDADTWVELDAVTVSVDTVTDILKLFLVHYIFNRLPVLPERLARTLSPDAARQADAQVLELIAGLVEVHLPPDPLTFDWRGPAGQSFAELTLLDAYQIIEAEGQRS